MGVVPGIKKFTPECIIQSIPRAYGILRYYGTSRVSCLLVFPLSLYSLLAGF